MYFNGGAVGHRATAIVLLLYELSVMMHTAWYSISCALGIVIQYSTALIQWVEQS